jgi:ankyrin repeat protein/chromosome segregation ATPase
MQAQAGDLQEKMRASEKRNEIYFQLFSKAFELFSQRSPASAETRSGQDVLRRSTRSAQQSASGGDVSAAQPTCGSSGELAEIRNELSAAKEHMGGILAKLNGEPSQNSDLVDSFKKRLEKSRKNAQMQQSASSQRIYGIELRLKRLRESERQLMGTEASLREKITELNKTVENQINSSNNRLNEAECNIVELTRALDKANKEEDEFRRKCEELAREVELLKQQNDDSAELVESLQSQVTDLQAAEARFRTKLNPLQRKLADTRRERDEYQAVADSTFRNSGVLSKENGVLSEKNETLEKQLLSANSAIDKKSREVASLRCALDIKSQELDSLRRELDDTRAESDEHQASADSKSGKCDVLRKETRILEERLDKKNQENKKQQEALGTIMVELGRARLLAEAERIQLLSARDDLVAAVVEGSSKNFDRFAGAIPDFSTHPKFGEDLLRQSIHFGSLANLEKLLARGASLEMRFECGETSLHHAVLSGRIEMVEFILQNISKPIKEFINAVDENGDTALAYAVKNGFFKLIEILLENGADLTLTNHNGEDSLLKCVKYAPNDSRRSIFELLFDKVPEEKRRLVLNRHCRDDGQTTLHIVVAADRTGIYDLISPYSDLSARDKNGRTVLHLACELRDLQLFSFLVDEGCDKYIKDNNGNTPMDLVRALRDTWKQTESLLANILNE